MASGAVLGSPERAKLREAIQQLAEATKAAQDAEALHEKTSGAYYRQQGVIADINERMATLTAAAQRVPAAGRGEYWQHIEDCEPALREAKLPLMDLGQAEAEAKTAAEAASRRIGFYNDHVLRAATTVAQAEASAVAAAMANRLTDALRTVAQVGPDLAYMLHAGLVAKDVVAAEPFAARLVNWLSTEWPAFAVATRCSPWRGVVAALSNDPDAPLPPPPAP